MLEEKYSLEEYGVCIMPNKFLMLMQGAGTERTCTWPFSNTEAEA